MAFTFTSAKKKKKKIQRNNCSNNQDDLLLCLIYVLSISRALSVALASPIKEALLFLFCVLAKSLSGVRRFCDLSDSSVHGISQARILERVAISSSRGSSPPKDVSCLGRRIIYL